MNKVVKCKLVDLAEGKSDLVEALLEGDALTHWMEFKCVETTYITKKPDGTYKPTKYICDNTFKVCLQELKRHYFPKNLAWIQKAYLHNRIKKPNKLSIEKYCCAVTQSEQLADALSCTQKYSNVKR
eukprot:8334679-Ditylum_brightwellii.AAC.1